MVNTSQMHNLAFILNLKCRMLKDKQKDFLILIIPCMATNVKLVKILSCFFGNSQLKH